MASPNPNPNASPCTSATLINGDALNARLSSMMRADSLRIPWMSRPARSRPVQKTSPRARIRKTRELGRDASDRSSTSIASNIVPVTSLEDAALSNVKVRISPDRSIVIPATALIWDESTGLLGDMPPPYTRNGRQVNSRAKVIRKSPCGGSGHTPYGVAAGFPFLKRSRTVCGGVNTAALTSLNVTDSKIKTCGMAELPSLDLTFTICFIGTRTPSTSL
jgi:hypothetical protein